MSYLRREKPRDRSPERPRLGIHLLRRELEEPRYPAIERFVTFALHYRLLTNSYKNNSAILSWNTVKNLSLIETSSGYRLRIDSLPGFLLGSNRSTKA